MPVASTATTRNTAMMFISTSLLPGAVIKMGRWSVAAGCIGEAKASPLWQKMNHAQAHSQIRAYRTDGYVRYLWVVDQRRPARFPGPPLLMGVPGAKPTPGAPTPGVATAARAT